MNLRTLTSIGASLAVITGVVTANLWREMRTQRAETTELQAELAQIRARAAVAPPRPVENVAPEPPTVPPSAPAGTVPQSQRDNASTKSMVQPGVVAIIGDVRLTEQDLMKDPEYRKARLVMLRASVARNYPGLADALGLTQEESDELFDLLVETQLATTPQLALVTTRDAESDQAAAAEINRRRQELTRQQNDALRAFLGENRYTQWGEYHQTRPVRMQAINHADVLALAGAPLNDGQLKTLMTAMVDEQKHKQQDILELGRTVSRTNPQTREAALEALQNLQVTSNQRIINATSSELTTQQIGLLRAQFEQRDAVDNAAARFRQRADAATLQQ